MSGKSAEDMHFETLNRIVPVNGLKVADIGCGRGELARRMRSAGADVTGVECTEAQIAVAREKDPDNAEKYLEGVGQDLPLPDDAFDLVTFSYSLHHVPVDVMSRALDEARRVLKPKGRLYVLEPVADGEMYTLDRLIDDEAEVRREAQTALAAHDGFHEIHRETYETHYSYTCVDELIASMTAIDETRKRRAEENDALVRAAFEGGGENVAGFKRFAQPNLVLMFERV